MKKPRPRQMHPETLGKIERFWGALWRECLETAVLRGLDDARRRIGLFIDRYDVQRSRGMPAANLPFPEPLSPIGGLQDHPETADRDEVLGGGSGLDHLLSDLLDEEETP